MTDHTTGQPGIPGRRPWSTPALSRVRLGEAQGGANPINPEGQIATGS